MLDLHYLTQQLIQPRPRHSHKGTFGRVLLIGGLSPYGGAIILTSLACVNSGAGLVTVATEPTNISALHAHLPEAMAFSVDDTELLLAKLRESDLVLIGPGLGEDSRAKQILSLTLTNVSQEQILVLDGSALNLVAQSQNMTFPTKQVVLTPHQKEWERLSGTPISEQNPTSIRLALSNYPSGLILVAKSHQTAIYQAGKADRAQLTIGGSHQATGGMGDTLAGMIAGFAVQFKDYSLFERICVATYLHSYIADHLADKYYMVRPSQISAAIQSTMQQFCQEKTSF